MIYFLVYAYIFFVAFVVNNLYHIDSKKGKQFFVVAIFVVLFLLSGLRGETVGSDTVAYTQTYQIVSNSQITDLYKNPYVRSIEYSYLFFMKLLTYVSPNPQLYLIVTSFMICFGFGYFIYKNSEDVFVATIAYYGLFFWESMSISRQYIAMAMSLNSLYLIRDKKYISSLILMVASFFAHKSVVFFWIIAFLYLLREKSYFLPLIFLGTFFVFCLYKSNLIITIIEQTPYAHYIGSKYMKKSYLGGTIDKVYMLITLFSITLLSYKQSVVQKLNITKDRLYCEDWFYVSMMVINSTLLYIAREYMPVMRVALYFSIFAIILIPSIFKYLEQYKILVKIAFSMAMLVLVYISSVDYSYEFLFKN